MDLLENVYLASLMKSQNVDPGITFLVTHGRGMSLLFQFQGLVYGGNDTLFESTGLFGKVRVFIFFPSSTCLFSHFSFAYEVFCLAIFLLMVRVFSLSMKGKKLGGYFLLSLVQRMVIRFSWEWLVVTNGIFTSA